MDFETFVAARWPVLVRTAVLLGCSRPEAEDLVQTALTRCLAAWGRVSTADDPHAYVYRVLVNALRTSRARHWWGETPSDQRALDRLVGDAAETVAVSVTVQAALDRLTPAHRQVLVLRFYADLGERQVAEVLGVPPGTVKSRVSRALHALSADADIASLSRRG